MTFNLLSSVSLSGSFSLQTSEPSRIVFLCLLIKVSEWNKQTRDSVCVVEFHESLYDATFVYPPPWLAG